MVPSPQTLGPMIWRPSSQNSPHLHLFECLHVFSTDSLFSAFCWLKLHCSLLARSSTPVIESAGASEEVLLTSRARGRLRQCQSPVHMICAMDAAMLASILLTRLDGPDLPGSFSRGGCHAAQHRGREGLMAAGHCSTYLYIGISFRIRALRKQQSRRPAD